MPNGRKGWRLRYVKPDGREGLTSFGNYPVIGLADARRKRLEVKRMLPDGVDPIETKNQAKAVLLHSDDAATRSPFRKAMEIQLATEKNDIPCVLVLMY